MINKKYTIEEIKLAAEIAQIDNFEYFIETLESINDNSEQMREDMDFEQFKINELHDGMENESD